MTVDEGMEEQLAGGNVSIVVRVGETVRRPVQSWTPAVHRLLARLDAAGYPHAPRAQGVDERGREVLEFVPGRMGGFPYDPWLLTDAGLDAVIDSITALHDATAGSDLLDAPGWQPVVPTDLPRDVICHGDLAPYNLVLRNDADGAAEIAGWIDFDTACPGPRLWDLAYAAYTFVPLYAEGHNLPGDLDRAARLDRLDRFAERANADGAGLLAMIDRRLDWLVAWLEDGAAAGDPPRVAMVADGHAAMYRRERVALGAWR